MINVISIQRQFRATRVPYDCAILASARLQFNQERFIACGTKY